MDETTASWRRDDEGASRRYFSLWMEAGMCSPWMQVIGLAHRVTIPKEATLFGEGRRVDGVYLLVEGVLRLVSFDENGNEAILLYVTEQNLVGESAFFNRMPVYATYSAVEDATLFFFDEATLNTMLSRSYPALQRNLLEYMGYKIGVLLHHQCEVISDDVTGKISRMLFDIAKYSHFQPVIHSKITQHEMATALGLHRATFSKTISELKRQGVLEWTKKREIVIHDYERIREYAHNVFAL